MAARDDRSPGASLAELRAPADQPQPASEELNVDDRIELTSNILLTQAAPWVQPQQRPSLSHVLRHRARLRFDEHLRRRPPGPAGFQAFLTRRGQHHLRL